MLPDFRNAIAQFIEHNARPVDKYGHQPRLYALTQQVGAGLDYDDDVIYAAAWLHDLGVFIGHRPEDPEQLAKWNHVTYACQHVPQILTGANFPAEKIPAVLEAIRTHQPTDNPTIIEAIILRDADILEQLGAIGILRNVSKVGRDTRFSQFTQIVTVLRRSLADLPAKIRLDSTRKLAEPRIHALRQFLAAVDDEAGSLLF